MPTPSPPSEGNSPITPRRRRRIRTISSSTTDEEVLEKNLFQEKDLDKPKEQEKEKQKEQEKDLTDNEETTEDVDEEEDELQSLASIRSSQGPMQDEEEEEEGETSTDDEEETLQQEKDLQQEKESEKEEELLPEEEEILPKEKEIPPEEGSSTNKDEDLEEFIKRRSEFYRKAKDSSSYEEEVQELASNLNSLYHKLEMSKKGIAFLPMEKILSEVKKSILSLEEVNSFVRSIKNMICTVRQTVNPSFVDAQQAELDFQGLLARQLLEITKLIEQHKRILKYEKNPSKEKNPLVDEEFEEPSTSSTSDSSTCSTRDPIPTRQKKSSGKERKDPSSTKGKVSSSKAKVVVYKSDKECDHLTYFGLKAKDMVKGKDPYVTERIKIPEHWQTKTKRIELGKTNKEYAQEVKGKNLEEFRICIGRYPNGERCFYTAKGEGKNLSTHAKKYHKQYFLASNKQRQHGRFNYEVWAPSNCKYMEARRNLMEEQINKWQIKYAKDSVNKVPWTNDEKESFSYKRYEVPKGEEQEDSGDEVKKEKERIKRRKERKLEKEKESSQEKILKKSQEKRSQEKDPGKDPSAQAKSNVKEKTIARTVKSQTISSTKTSLGRKDTLTRTEMSESETTKDSSQEENPSQPLTEATNIKSGKKRPPSSPSKSPKKVRKN